LGASRFNCGTPTSCIGIMYWIIIIVFIFYDVNIIRTWLGTDEGQKSSLVLRWFVQTVQTVKSIKLKTKLHNILATILQNNKL